jgi:hypothetical protein
MERSKLMQGAQILRPQVPPIQQMLERKIRGESQPMTQYGSKDSPHLQGKLIGGIVDLHLLSQTPKKDARNIRGIVDKSIFWRSIMVINSSSKALSKWE